MASRYWGINRNQSHTDVAEGASTNSKTFEFVVNLADGASRSEAIMALRYIEGYIISRGWPPA